MATSRLLSILVAAAALLGYWAHFFDAFKKLKDFANCELIGSDVLHGSEDMTMYKDGIALLSSGDLHSLFAVGKGSPGDIFALEFTTRRLAPVPRIGYPSATPFQPHGIFFSNKTSRLYVINHQFRPGGEVIDVFSVVDVKDSNSFPPVRLEYLESVSSSPGQFGNCALNDVVEGGDENELYVSRWLVYPTPYTGEKHPVTWKEKLNTLLKYSSLVAKRTHIYRCARASAGEPWKCAVTGTPGHGWNGMSTTPERDYIFANDVLAKALTVFQRRPGGSLAEVGKVSSPHAMDNMEYDATSRVLVAGTIPLLTAAAKKMEGGSGIYVPGGVVAFRHEPETPNLDLLPELELNHDGSVLSQISTGLLWGDEVFLGSPFSNGVAICDARSN